MAVILKGAGLGGGRSREWCLIISACFAKKLQLPLLLVFLVKSNFEGEMEKR